MISRTPADGGDASLVGQNPDLYHHVMSAALAPSSGQQEIKRFLGSVAEKLNDYADLDDHWKVQGSSRFGAVAADALLTAKRFDDPFRLAVVGEFNSGKSALINALLGRSGLLTEGVTPTTGTITELWWTDEPESGTVSNAAGEQVFEGPVVEAIKYADQRTQEGQSITGVGARVVLRVHHDLLSNLVIMDTPGLGSNPTDDKVTSRELSNADAAIVTVSARQPGAETTVQLAEKLRVLDRKMLVAVTWIDKVNDRKAVLDLVAGTFAEVADGEPVGFASPTVIAAQQTLAESSGADADVVTEAWHTLERDGFASLRARVEAELQLGLVRSATVLKDAGRNLALLGARAGREAEAARKDVTSISAEMTEAEAHVHDVLMPKASFVAAKIDEIVELRVSEYMSDLTTAVDLFIDRLSSGRYGLGAQVLWGKVSSRARRKLEKQLLEEFSSVFPEDRYELMSRQISRSVGDLIQFEWRKAAAPEQGGGEGYNPRQVTDQVTRELAKLTSRVAVEGLAWVTSLFIPGAALLGVVMMMFNVDIVGRTSERIMLTKQMARTRLIIEGRQLTEHLSSQFRKVNDGVRDGLIDEAREDRPRQEQHRIDLMEAASRWGAAVADMNRLIDAGGEQAHQGAGR
jgi:GTP-binding protein EngB required for normal cell division